MNLSWHYTDQVWLLMRLTWVHTRYFLLLNFRTFLCHLARCWHQIWGINLYWHNTENCSLLYPFMYSFRSYASLKFVGAGRGHVLLQQYLQYACFVRDLLTSNLYIYRFLWMYKTSTSSYASKGFDFCLKSCLISNASDFYYQPPFVCCAVTFGICILNPLSLWPWLLTIPLDGEKAACTRIPMCQQRFCKANISTSCPT